MKKMIKIFIIGCFLFLVFNFFSCNTNEITIEINTSKVFINSSFEICFSKEYSIYQQNIVLSDAQKQALNIVNATIYTNFSVDESIQINNITPLTESEIAQNGLTDIINNVKSEDFISGTEILKENIGVSEFLLKYSASSNGNGNGNIEFVKILSYGYFHGDIWIAVDADEDGSVDYWIVIGPDGTVRIIVVNPDFLQP